jgi:predicted ATPase
MQLVEESNSKVRGGAWAIARLSGAACPAANWRPDPAQAAAMERLQALWQALRRFLNRRLG